MGSGDIAMDDLASDESCEYDDLVKIDASDIAPTVTWGINPGQAIGIDQTIPDPESAKSTERASIAEAIDYMKLTPGAPIKGTPRRRSVHRFMHKRQTIRP